MIFSKHKINLKNNYIENVYLKKLTYFMQLIKVYINIDV